MGATGPIVVFGTGRSGTTVLHQMLAAHPDVAWLSRVCNGFPQTAPLHRAILRSVGSGPIDRLIRNLLPADECYRFWDRLYPGFSEPCRDLVADDVTARVELRIHEAAAALVTHRRSRLLFKITGWPRLGFLARVFPDATFVHVVRDGRAVANSLLDVEFWRGWGGPQKWRWGPLAPAYEAEWDHHDRSFVVLAALQWKILMDAAEAASGRIDPAQLHVIRYENLCDDPVGTFRELADACGLAWSSTFEASIGARAMTDTTDRYCTDLTAPQRADLDVVLAEHLHRYGYL